MQPPTTLAQMTKKRSVSIGLPGPTMVSHQPGLPVTGMGIGHVLVAGERVADQDGVGAGGVERAVGLVGDLPGSERHTRIHHQRLVRAEARDRARRLVDLAARFNGQGSCDI